MRKTIYITFFFLATLLSSSLALQGPVSNNNKNYYMVTSTDPTEDTGDEVCAKAGLVCAGYTDSTNTICKNFHPNAADTQSASGDSSTVYCNGSPQNGVCASRQNSCHACQACTVSVQCNQPIGNLYREMYVECSTGKCNIKIGAKNTKDFLNQLSGINQQLQACPITLPSNFAKVVPDGNTIVDVLMSNGITKSFSLTIKNNKITGISSTIGTCKQRLTIKETNLDQILQSSSISLMAQFLLAQKSITIKGCSFLSKLKFFFVSPIIKSVAKKQAPNPPPPPPPPNCGQVGEQCNNRACFSGICAAPEENINGQWMYANYRCISQSDWSKYCESHGNTPSLWRCITGPCR